MNDIAQKAWVDQQYSIQPIIDQIHEAAEVVGSTFGPAGSQAILQAIDGSVLFTRDGHTVMEFLSNKPLPGYKLLADACSSTVRKAGDGTTSTALLASALIRTGRSVREYLDDVMEFVAMPDDIRYPDKAELVRIAQQTSHDDHLGKLIGELIFELGPDGFVRGVIGEEEGYSIQNGYKLGAGVMLPDFLKIRHWNAPYAFVAKNGSVSLENPYILIINETLQDVKIIQTILKDYQDRIRWERPLLIILGDAGVEVMRYIMTNFTERRLPVFVVKAPGEAKQRFDMLTDVGYATDAFVYGKHSKGLARFDGQYGWAQMVEISNEDCRIVTSTDLSAYVAELKEQGVEDKERLSKLNGKIGTLTFRDSLTSTMRSVQLSVEDAIHATQHAQKSGFVLGGRRLWQSLAEAFPEIGEAFSDLAERLPEEGVPLDPLNTIQCVITNAFDLAQNIYESRYTVAATGGSRPSAV